NQLLLKIKPRHTGHRNIDYQALCECQSLRCQKLLCRGERPGLVTEFPKQVGQRLPYGLVIIDDCDECALLHQIFLGIDAAKATFPIVILSLPSASYRPVHQSKGNEAEQTPTLASFN